ncbi:MAG: hypothetical protein AB9828_05375 [Sphaerochaetaceae bacterium]
MRFCEKLNLLMKMNNTTNHKLAAALAIDPSMISRWRTGARELDGDSPYIARIGSYFASQAKQTFQRVALLELTGYTLEDKHVDEAVLASHTARWLANASRIKTDAMQDFLQAIGAPPVDIQSSKNPPVLPAEPCGEPLSAQMFQGDGGLRNAVVKLLLTALQHGQEGTLLLYSDQPMDWLAQDQVYIAKWAFLMAQCIKKGIRIQIIHTIARDASELLMAIQNWLPFYLTGAITSYYHPVKQDALFYHTFFTLTGCATVFSQSVRTQNRDSVQYIYGTDPQLVLGTQEIFQAQLLDCKPLVRILSGDALHNYTAQLTTFLSTEGGAGMGLQAVPVSGLSWQLLERMLIRMEVPLQEQRTIIPRYIERTTAQRIHQESQLFTMAVSLPKLKDVVKGRIPAVIPELMSHRNCYFEAGEFAEHLGNLIDLVENSPNLQVCIIPCQDMPQDIQLFAKMNVGLIILKPHDPAYMFIAQQRDMVNALYSYISRLIASIPKRKRSKEYVLDRLRQLKARIDLALQDSTEHPAGENQPSIE